MGINHTILVVLLTGFLLNACTNSSQQPKAGNGLAPVDTVSKTGNKPLSAAHGDTLLVYKKAAVWVEVDSLTMKKRKQEIGKQKFSVAADDYMFYLSMAHHFLDSVKLNNIKVKDKRFLKFMSNNGSSEVIRLDTLPELWHIYFFYPGRKAKKVEITSVEEAYKEYFK